MERSQVLDAMGQLKLYGMRTAYDEIIATAVKRQHEPQQIIGDLLTAEISEKQARSIKYQMTIAKLPLVGSLLSVASLPLFAGGITYAVGKVFITHFASGGTFLDFDPDKVRSYFNQQVGKVKSTVAPATA